MIQTVLLDIDMTILDFHTSEKKALTKTLENMGVEPTAERLARYSQINLSQWKLLEKGELTRDRLKVRRFELFIEEMDLPLQAVDMAKSYEHYLAQGYDYLPGAKEMLASICDKYDLYILSNGSSDIQHSRIAGAGLAPYFQDIFISEDVGFNKPDARFFDHCFAEIAKKKGSFDKTRAVMVGDSLTSDIAGGKNSGVKTIWYNPNHQLATELQPDYEIETITDLEKLLAQL